MGENPSVTPGKNAAKMENYTKGYKNYINIGSIMKMKHSFVMVIMSSFHLVSFEA